MDNELKHFNTVKFQRNKKKTQRGARPQSPWWYLIGKIQKRLLAKKDLREDFTIYDWKPIKINDDIF
jgi:hypothetical protein